MATSTLFCSDQPSSSTSVMFSSTDSQSLLCAVQGHLEQQHCSFQDLVGIVVVPGAARFTASRLVVVLANTIAWSMHIPVMESHDMPHDSAAALALVQHATSGSPLAPRYSKDPRIS